MREAKCKCGAEIEEVLDTPLSAGKFWQRVGTAEVCFENHWHEPEATATIPTLLQSIDAVMDEYRQFSGQNDPQVNTGLARLWGAKRIADLVRASLT